MIGRKHDLLRLEPELVGDFFDCVYGSAVHVGLAGLAKTAIVGVDAEALEQRFERRGAAVHVGGLDDLWNDEPGVRFHGFPIPAARRAMVAGETRSVSISTDRGCARLAAGCESRRLTRT